MKLAAAAPRQRNSSSRQSGRPRPGTSGVCGKGGGEGMLVIRHRVAAAEGACSAGSSKRRDRRRTNPSTSVAPAASCSRREATRSSRPSCSHTTPARPGWRRPSSMARRAPRRVLTRTMRAGSRPARARAGGYRSHWDVIHSNGPIRRASTAATNSAGAAPCSTAGPFANSSCTAPKPRPWPGNHASSSGTPNGRHADGDPVPVRRSKLAICMRRVAMVSACISRIPICLSPWHARTYGEQTGFGKRSFVRLLTQTGQRQRDQVYATRAASRG